MTTNNRKLIVENRELRELLTFYKAKNLEASLWRVKCEESQKENGIFQAHIETLQKTVDSVAGQLVTEKMKVANLEKAASFLRSTCLQLIAYRKKKRAENRPGLPLWVVVYTHQYGMDTFLIRSETEPTQKQLVDGLADFEPERCESIESFYVSVSEPYTIEDWQNREK